MQSPKQEAWFIDQLSKSAFFHQKLHAWGMLEVADALELVKGESLDWNLEHLSISQKAWDKIIHRGIKPVIAFAHPKVLTSISRSTGYYRMLAMVSQKSMNQIGVPITRYEQENVQPTYDLASVISAHLNKIISTLIETDEYIDEREFMLWRGMAAGSQAQGSWQNAKGDKGELLIKSLLQKRLQEKELISATEASEESRYLVFSLTDGRTMYFGDEPDIGFYRDDMIESAVEIKGGIDKAGVLERVGAAIKSLRRAKEENPESITILVMQAVSITQQAVEDLKSNREAVNYWFTVEELIEDENKRETFFGLLNI